jgi:hypothetical protein
VLDVRLSDPELRTSLQVRYAYKDIGAFRGRFLDFTGRFVHHCHMMNHEELGMMQVVEVYCIVRPPRGNRGLLSGKRSAIHFQLSLPTRPIGRGDAMGF